MRGSPTLRYTLDNSNSSQILLYNIIIIALRVDPFFLLFFVPLELKPYGSAIFLNATRFASLNLLPKKYDIK